MFCSNCKRNEKNHIEHYRIAAKQITSLEKFYKNLAQEEQFCVNCGKSCQKTNQSKIINTFFSGYILLTALVPTSLIVISSKNIKEVVTAF